MNDIPWPKKGDKAFVDRTNVSRAFNPIFLSVFGCDWALPGFREAADIILKAIETMPAGDRTPLILPVGFLYRHCLEVLLKQIVTYAQYLDVLRMERNEAKKVLGGHDLVPLWQKARQVLCQRWPGEDPAELEAVEQIVMEFHAIDGNGQGFRYGKSSQGERLLKDLPAQVDPCELRRVLAGVCNYLQTSADALCDALAEDEEVSDENDAEDWPTDDESEKT